MFHNSTTLHRSSIKNFQLGMGGRVVYNAKLDKLKTIGKKGLSVLGKTAKIITMPFGGPVLWRTAKLSWKSIKLTLDVRDKARWVLSEVKEGAIETGKGIIDPLVAPVISVKRNLLDLAIRTGKESVQGGIAIAKTPINLPGNLAKGAKEGVENLFGGTRDVLESIFRGNIKGIISGTRKATLGTLSPTFNHVTSDFREIGKRFKDEVVKAHDPYWNSIPNFFEKAKNGSSRILNSYKAAPKEKEREIKTQELSTEQ